MRNQILKCSTDFVRVDDLFSVRMVFRRPESEPGGYTGYCFRDTYWAPCEPMYATMNPVRMRLCNFIIKSMEEEADKFFKSELSASQRGDPVPGMPKRGT